VTTTLPRWRFVPFASTLLICSGLFMLVQTSPAPSARPLDQSNACDGKAPGLPHSMSSAVTQEDPQSPDDDDDDAPTGSDAATASGDRVAARLDAMCRVIEMEADPRPFRALDAHLLRGPPSDRPDPDDLDDIDDDDKDDDDCGRDEDRAVPSPVDSHNPRIVARADFLRAFFATSEQSLRAPPQ
jgi:hypothetical protein